MRVYFVNGYKFPSEVRKAIRLIAKRSQDAFLEIMGAYPFIEVIHAMDDLKVLDMILDLDQASLAELGVPGARFDKFFLLSLTKPVKLGKIELFFAVNEPVPQADHPVAQPAISSNEPQPDQALTLEIPCLPALQIE